MAGVYRGFSFHEYQNKKLFGIKDIELVKLDLLNHIYTRKGSRVMMPEYGTRIPDMAFEQLDELTLMVLEEDINTVINFDPRVRKLSMSITPNYDANYVTIDVRLLYVEFNVTDTMNLNIQFDIAA